MPITMSYANWISRTGGGARPVKLRAVDYAFTVYTQRPSEENRLQLRKSLMPLIADKSPAGSSSQGFSPNTKTAIHELYRQVSSLSPLNKELIEKAQGRVKTQIFGGEVQETQVPEGAGFNQITREKIYKFGHVGDSDAILGKITEDIATGLDCKISYGPIKKDESASRKVREEYGGDWLQVKDAVRVTIIATRGGTLLGVSPDALIPIQAKIRSVCTPSNGMTLIKDEETKVNSPGNACGYSGLNFVARLSTGWPGEIQANIPSIMYGKMSEEELCSKCGRPGYETVKAAMDIEGGIGHIFYEIWRVDKTGRNGLRAASLSCRYYEYLRDPQGRRSAKDALKAEIAAFKIENRAKFAEKH